MLFHASFSFLQSESQFEEKFIFFLVSNSSAREASNIFVFVLTPAKRNMENLEWVTCTFQRWTASHHREDWGMLSSHLRSFGFLCKCHTSPACEMLVRRQGGWNTNRLLLHREVSQTVQIHHLHWSTSKFPNTEDFYTSVVSGLCPSVSL